MRKLRIIISFSVLFLLSTAVLAGIQFEEVSQQAGITRIGESWGNAWGDFDGDGYLDLWATNHKHKPSLYRNNRDGTFTDIIDQVWNAYPFTDTHGAAWADYDNDGDQDLIVLSGGGGGVNPANPRQYNHFYVNENGRLHERAAEFGIRFPLLRGRTPLWLDWDRDGRLDLLVTGIRRLDKSGESVTSVLFGQTMTGFEDVGVSAGFMLDGTCSLAQIANIVGGNTPDLIVHSNPTPEKIYDISTIPFVEMTSNFNFPTRYNVMDSIFADFNGDLQTDVFLAQGTYYSYFDLLENDLLRIYIQTNMGGKGISFMTDGEVTFEIHSIWATQHHQLNIGA